jgi:aldehyde dehydrogenase (NAD+)
METIPKHQMILRELLILKLGTVKSVIEPSKVIFLVGNQQSLYIAPTLIDESDVDSKIMQEEIFGPILPILSYSNKADIQIIFSKYEKPLALYVLLKM